MALRSGKVVTSWFGSGGRSKGRMGQKECSMTKETGEIASFCHKLAKMELETQQIEVSEGVWEGFWVGFEVFCEHCEF